MAVHSFGPAERAEHYRRMAAEAAARAERMPHFRTGFLKLAARWEAVAAEIERRLECEGNRDRNREVAPVTRSRGQHETL